MNNRGDIFELFFFGAIGIMLLAGFLPIINDLVGQATTQATAATNLTYMSYLKVLIAMAGFFLAIAFIRSWWRTSGTG